MSFVTAPIVAYRPSVQLDGEQKWRGRQPCSGGDVGAPRKIKKEIGRDFINEKKKASNILDTVGDVVTVSVAFVASIVSSMRPTRHQVHR